MTPSSERIAELALGASPSEDEALAIAADPVLAAELAALTETLGVLPLALPSKRPPPSLRARLLADTADPWWRALDVFARLADTTVERLKGCVAAARAADWVRWPDAGVELYHVGGGPKTVNADVGFVRAPPNHAFPDHRHFGGEQVVILEGSMLLDGRRIVTGEIDERGPGSVHNWVAGPEGVVFGAVVYVGVELVGGGSLPDDR